jgi:tetratricopeptide (TPR) repeat protein
VGTGLYRQARPLAERALALTEAALGPQDVRVSSRCTGLGRVLQALGDLAGARVQFERAVAIGEATLPRDHPNLVVYRGDLAAVAAELGKSAEVQDLGDLAGAKAQKERALAIREDNPWPRPPDRGHDPRQPR